jgi:hypothetical protein
MSTKPTVVLAIRSAAAHRALRAAVLTGSFVGDAATGSSASGGIDEARVRRFEGRTALMVPPSRR